jgi:uncharacterized protein
MDLLGTLAILNPWWRTSSVPESLRGRPRRMTEKIVGALDLPEVIALTGVRRAGKTTLLYQLADEAMRRGTAPQEVLFANLEDPALAGAGLEDLVRAHRQGFGADRLRLILLDEVQARTGWEAWVNAQYERKTGLKIAVSGSTSSLMRGELARLLTGRSLTYEVRPLGCLEAFTFHGATLPHPPYTAADRDHLIHHLDRYLETGGFPEANLRGAPERRMLLQEYFQGIVARDLVHHHHLDPERIERFALYLAATFARPHTRRALATATGVSVDTVREYLLRLEDVFLVQLVHRFSWSPKPHLEDRAPIKPYFVDTGLRAAVAPDHAKDQGRLAENLVATTLRARGLRPSYWTDGKGRHEVDFVQPRPDGVLDAYQVTYGETIPEREMRALMALRESLPPARVGTFTLLTRNEEGEQDGIPLVPLWRWLIEEDRRE